MEGDRLILLYDMPPHIISIAVSPPEMFYKYEQSLFEQYHQ